MATGSTEAKPGRPSKYDPSYCDQIVEFMGRGYSMTAFAGEIGVARSTINEWMGEHPAFSEAVKVGQAKRTRQLEMTLLAGETGPKVTAHIFALKNAAPEEWKDKREFDHTVREAPAEEMSEEELLAIAAGSRC
jgi:hypothetical protein